MARLRFQPRRQPEDAVAVSAVTGCHLDDECHRFAFQAQHVQTLIYLGEFAVIALLPII